MWWRHFISLFRCPLCKQALNQPQGLCQECDTWLKRFEFKDFLLRPDVQKQLGKTRFSHLYCLGFYAWPLNELVRAFKYNKQTSLAVPMANKMSIPAGELPDAWLATPMHDWRYFYRGYNQAELLTQALHRQYQIPVYTGLVRQRWTRSQTRLSKRQRQQNLRRAFYVRTSPPAHIGLVDDVVTTGSTANEISRELLRAGCEKVSVWSLCFTPLPNG